MNNKEIIQGFIAISCFFLVVFCLFTLLSPAKYDCSQVSPEVKQQMLTNCLEQKRLEHEHLLASIKSEFKLKAEQELSKNEGGGSISIQKEQDCSTSVKELVCRPLPFPYKILF